MNILNVTELSASYGGKKVIDNLSFELKKGHLTGLLGANGSGKTTVLKAICGILPHKGNCYSDGILLEKLSPAKMAAICSYIPQRSGISIDIPALDVVCMGYNPRLHLLETPDRSMKKQAAELLKYVGLEGKEESNYLHLSEGQKQLCILARTLAADGRVLLLDEPESALDFRFRYRMLEILKHWVKEGERTALVALHDPMLALNCCDSLLLLSEGKICGSVSPRMDSLSEMEEKLTEIYGPVSLHRCMNRVGSGQLVMLKEPETL